jgi:large subunit ribosomal protein L4e
LNIQVYDLQGNIKKTIELPKIFETPLRPDVIKRAVLAQQSHGIQPQGRDPMAGKRTSAISMGTGHGTARLPRVKGSRFPRAQQGAFAPSTVGGRLTHPPRSEKKIYKFINKKERRLAIRSAIAATANKTQIAYRGHIVEDVPTFPLVIVDELQDIDYASEARKFFTNLGLWRDLERVYRSRKIRAGKGKMRGRKRRHSVGPLLVIHKNGGVRKAVSNFLGVDVIKVNYLNSEALAPGTVPGRLTVWTSSAIDDLKTLFM